MISERIKETISYLQSYNANGSMKDLIILRSDYIKDTRYKI